MQITGDTQEERLSSFSPMFAKKMRILPETVNTILVWEKKKTGKGGYREARTKEKMEPHSLLERPKINTGTNRRVGISGRIGNILRSIFFSNFLLLA